LNTERPFDNAVAGGLPRFNVSELNEAIGKLLERGFAPRFLLEATVSRAQLKKGHLWLTLTDELASVSGVVWASVLPRLSFKPEDGDGVTVVGKLQFLEQSRLPVRPDPRHPPQSQRRAASF